jgi:hypothetical protein
MLVIFLFIVVASGFLAGAAKVDCRLPVGTPLAGINHGGRRVKDFPIPHPTKYTTWMNPSTGVMGDGIWCRALTIQDDAGNMVTFVSLDAIGADGTMRKNAIRFARSFEKECSFFSIFQLDANLEDKVLLCRIPM